MVEVQAHALQLDVRIVEKEALVGIEADRAEAHLHPPRVDALAVAFQSTATV